MKKTAIILLAIVMAMSAKAQMTLQDCLLYASEHAHANIINRLDIRKAQLDKGITASNLMPYLGFSSNGNMSFGRNIDPETNTYDNRRTLSTGFGLSLSIPVFDGLVSINNLKAAKVAELRQIASARIEQDRISLDVIRAFYNVSYCKEMVEQVCSQLERDSTDLAATLRQEELGTKSGADVAELEAIVATDQYELTNQRNLLAKAYIELKGCMGLEPTPEPLDIVETTYEPNSSSMLSHPKIEEAEYALSQSRYSLRAAKGSFSPRISFDAGISTSYYRMIGTDNITPNFSEQWRNNMGQYLGFSFSFPLFTGLSNTKKLKRANIELEQSRQRLEQVKYEIEKETSEASLDLQAATEELNAATRRVEAEEIAYKAIRRKYEIGMSSAIDLYTSSAKLAQARANQEGKRIQRIIAAILLDYYHGSPLIQNSKFKIQNSKLSRWILK
ncbi:MAG: TolC family protein [Muribaculum sp.]|nr:TolC family protein [Muribaculum sp.]